MKNNPLIPAVVLLLMLSPLLACRASGQVATLEPSALPTATATGTLPPTETPSPTDTPDLTATQAYAGMQAVIQSLVARGYLGSADGSYYALADFSAASAQSDWYQPYPSRHEPTDFVLRAALSWESASKNPNPSGCGVVFHLQENGDHYLVLVSTDGNVYLGSAISNEFTRLGTAYYGTGSSSGQAALTLVVVGHTYRVLVDDKSIGTFTGYESRLEEGGMGFTVVSGSNVGFGTRCSMTDMGLWQIAP